jgi:hypothetical protein
VLMQGLGKLKQYNDLIGTRTRDLPACNIAPKPCTLPRAPQSKVSKQCIRTAEERTGSVLLDKRSEPPAPRRKSERDRTLTEEYADFRFYAGTRMGMSPCTAEPTDKHA